MDQKGRREYLIKYLLKESGYKNELPKNEEDGKRLLRALFNVREPKILPQEVLTVQDEYLKAETEKKGITDAKDLLYIDDMAVWKGDITTLKTDGIVNAANSDMLGCFAPCHGCIDNAIHTFAGVQLRNECAKIMEKQGKKEPTGGAKITGGYNLPAKYVLHTVGPIIYGNVEKKDEEALASCYHSCLALADKNGLKSIAFCCISTGEFRFPNERAAEIAVKTVKEYKQDTKSNIKIVFNVFKEIDYEIYKRLLRKNR